MQQTFALGSEFSEGNFDQIYLSEQQQGPEQIMYKIFHHFSRNFTILHP